MRQHVAKLAFAVVLVATVVFARWVQYHKQSATTLELDRQVILDSGVITLSIDSRWDQIDASRLPKHVLAGWIIPKTAVGQSVEVTVGRRRLRQALPTEAVGEAIQRHARRLGRIVYLEIDDELGRVDSFVGLSGQCGLVRSKTIQQLYVTVIYLSDGTVVELSISGSERLSMVLKKWLDQLASTMKLKPSAAALRVGADEAIEIDGWRLSIEIAISMHRDEVSGVVTLLPSNPSNIKSFWIAEGRWIRFGENRNGQAFVRSRLLNTHTLDDPLTVSKASKYDGRTLYKGARDETYAGLKLRKRTLTYLLVGRGDSALVFDVITDAAGGGRVHNLFDRTLARAEQHGEVPKTSELELNAFLSEADFGKLAEATSGWFVLRFGDEAIGFQIRRTTYNEQQGVISGRSFQYYRAGLFQEQDRSYCEFSKSLETGSSRTIVDVTQEDQRGKRSHHIVQDVAFDREDVTGTLSIDRGRSQQTVTRPADFVPDGAGMLVQAWLARKSVGGNVPAGEIVYTESSSLINDVQNTFVKVLSKEDKMIRVAAWSDEYFGPLVRGFGVDGVWQGADIGDTVTWRRTTEREIASAFPMRYREAMDWMRQTVGESR